MGALLLLTLITYVRSSSMCDKIVWKKGEIGVINTSAGAIPKGSQVTIQEDMCHHKILDNYRVQGSYKGETFNITASHLDKF